MTFRKFSGLLCLVTAIFLAFSGLAQARRAVLDPDTGPKIRAVTIQGRVDPANFLATHIVIDRINGRPYRGTHAPLVALP
ncbi:MAG: hypothetical protein WBV23_16350 [Desulfobaccales bacterium]